MSWKSVELQVALPRTVENSRNQQILQHQTQLQNMMDAENIAQHSLRAEQTVLHTGENTRTELRDRQEKKAAAKKETVGRARKDEEDDAPHPYKGQRLDIKM
ncbi:MAG: hypothetical protein WCC10_07555 [Tumebacillaceae bacterium]